MQILNDEIINMCSTTKSLILTGDCNGHTAELPDFISLDNFLADYFDLDNDTISYIDQTQTLTDNKIPLNRKSQDTKVNSTGRKLIDICKNNNLFIINGRLGQDRGIGKCTFRNKSLIDYTICSPTCLKMINEFEITDTNPIFSDGHSLLSMKLLCNFQNTDTSQIKNTKTNTHVKWNEKKKTTFVENINLEEITDISNLLNNFDNTNQQANMDTIANKISQTFMNCSNKTFKMDKNKKNTNKQKNNKPWFGPQCKNSRVIYNNARKKYKLYKTSQNKHDLNKAGKEYKKIMHKFINEHEHRNENKLRSMNKQKPKDYWRFLNSLKKKPQVEQPSLSELFDYFKEQNTSNDPENNADDPIFNLTDSDETLNSPITEQEINKMILKLNNSKTSSNDLILNEHIKSTKHIMLPIYCSLFNKVLDTGIIPESWSEGIILPIFKNKGSSLSPSNYRPITILSCLGKLFTSVLNTRLNSFLDKCMTNCPKIKQALDKNILHRTIFLY